MGVVSHRGCVLGAVPAVFGTVGELESEGRAMSNGEIMVLWCGGRRAWSFR